MPIATLAFNQEEHDMATNVKAEIKNNLLVITVDVSQDIINKAERSKTGKSRIIGSTHGFVKLPNGLSLGLNVIHK
jgi:adenylate kinase